MKTLNDFLFEYDSDDFKFNALQYRKGAKITGHFGLTEGYRKTDTGKMVWDTVRIHSGTDRSYHGTNDVNVVVSPFSFNRSEFHDYGENHVYGSVIRLFNDDYGFEMRIIHMYPTEIESTVLTLLKEGRAIKYNTIIGKAGDYGIFSGRHTHTEFVSMDEQCKVVDDLLELKFREDAFLPYTEEEIISIYQSTEFWKDERRSTLIIDNFKKQLEKRHIRGNMLNDYSYFYKDWYSGNAYRTRYSSEELFNNL